MTVLQLRVLEAARNVADASRRGPGCELSEMLRILRACVVALDADTPPHLAPVPETLGDLRAAPKLGRLRRRVANRRRP